MSETKIGLDGSRRKVAQLSLYDENGNLRRKLFIYGDGSVSYREWDSRGIDLEFGEVNILESIYE